MAIIDLTVNQMINWKHYTENIELTFYLLFESSPFSYLMWFFSSAALGEFNLKSTNWYSDWKVLQEGSKLEFQTSLYRFQIR